MRRTDARFQDPLERVLRVPPDMVGLHSARRFVCDAIAPWGGQLADAALMTSELVGNAIMHAGGQVTVRVLGVGSRALVEVHDQSSELPLLRAADPGRLGGNGMRIIDALSSRWGATEIKDDGKVVWFEVPLEP